MTWVSRVKLENWKNFRSADVPLRGRSFLVGPNASGKSNFLDLFRFLHDVARSGGGLQKAIEDRGGLSKIRCLAARQNPNLELTVELSDAASGATNGASQSRNPEWRYELVISQQVRGRRNPEVKSERVWRKGNPLLYRPDDADKTDPLRLTQTHLEQTSANKAFREFAEFFKSLLYLHIIPQLVRTSESFGRALPEDPYGRTFIERVARTGEKTRRGRLGRIERALEIAAPTMKGLNAVQDEAGKWHLETSCQHWRPDGAKQWEDQFSDGTLRLIGLLWSMLESDSLLLLEEPELSLNAAIVRKLAGLIARMQKRQPRQVILSTHSAELLSDRGIGLDEILLFEPRGKEGTSIRVSSSESQIKDLLEGGMTPADAIQPYMEPQNTQQLELQLDEPRA